MGLPETFATLRPSIVAFISRFIWRAPDAPLPAFPMIFGTGFFVSGTGMVATNRHIIDEIERINDLPENPRVGNGAVGALVFTAIERLGSEVGMAMLNVDILGWNALAEFEADSPWYGEGLPDLGFVQLNVRDTPAVTLAVGEHIIRAGVSIATAGFPEGNRTVTFHEHVTQLTPVLRHGIISSVFPFGFLNHTVFQSMPYFKAALVGPRYLIQKHPLYWE